MAAVPTARRGAFARRLALAAVLLAALFADRVPFAMASTHHTPSRMGASSVNLQLQRRDVAPGMLAFSLTMMGSRRGKGGNLKRSLDGGSGKGKVKSINSGRGQEITGVTLPKEGTIRGWAFGDDRTIACANVGGKYLAVDGQCPRCAFDLFKGKLLVDEDVWGPDPRVACPTCSVTYSLRTGEFGPEYKAKGLAGFVNTWAKTATVNSASQPVEAFFITKDEDSGQVFCRER